MLYPIVCTTSFVLDLLSHFSTGIIHSVYHKTINIELGNSIVSIQNSDSPISPISLISALSADEISALQVRKGDPVTITDGNICLSDRCTFSICDSERFSPVLAAAPALDRSVLYVQIHNVLSSSRAHGLRGLWFTPAPDGSLGEDLVLASAKSKLELCSSQLRSGCSAAAADTLTGLIGLGIGLTPSGDDFLCGAAAACTAFLEREHPFFHALIEQICKKLSNTNDISGMFLRCAASGMFSSAVCRLFSEHSENTAAQDFSAIGHSSGMDTLCGILFLLEQFELLNTQ